MKITKEQSLAGDIGLSYYGAKTHAEKAGWDFLKGKNPKFNFVSLNPPFVFGPIVNHVASVKDIGTSNAQLWTLIDGSQKGGEIPASFVWAWVDVRDLAEAHLLAYVRLSLIFLNHDVDRISYIGAKRCRQPAFHHHRRKLH